MENPRQNEPKTLFEPLSQRSYAEMVSTTRLTLAIGDLALRRRTDPPSPRQVALDEADLKDFIATEPLIIENDVIAAIWELGGREREEYQPALPEVGAIKTEAIVQSRSRRIAEAAPRSLGDGRREGEDSFAYSKRRYEEERAAGPDPELDTLNAQFVALVKKTTQPAPTSTPPPPPSQVSVGDMRPDSCDAFVTLLETLNHDELQAAMRTIATVKSDDDRAVVARALNALWLHKGKTARNLLVLVKGEKNA